MKKFKLLYILVVLFLLVTATSADCQNQQGKGRFGRKNRFQDGSKERQQGNRDLFNVFFMLDRDKNLELSAEEIGAVKNQQRLAKIKALDVNTDGKITYSEAADSFIGRRIKTVDKVKSLLQKKVENQLSAPIETGKMLEFYKAFQPNHDFYDEFDLNKDGKLDKEEALKSLPKVAAALFASRVKQIIEMVGNTPHKYEGVQHAIARSIDYDADNKITASEFKAFVDKILGKDVSAYYQKGQKPVADKIANTTQPANPSEDPQRLGKIESPQQAAAPEPVAADAAVDNFIVPEFTKTLPDSADAGDPLEELLGSGVDETLLW